MVTPLDVHVVVIAQGVHDYVRAGSSVVYVTYYVEGVDGQALDKVA